ncbi:MAG TPA: gamma-glutamyltransferase family protein [Phycisphaerae bacterium]|nr:gamma-glutamyltransferase family protein [Phycisphaerae bacterium]HRW55889.1 gamma-glutamyltransferase family protein [Phycisphaerae bacterium]
MAPASTLRRRFHILTLLLSLSLPLGCAAERDHSWTIDARRYAVAADHPDASAAGAEILAMGGNAVDAAVATSFALAVVRPESCGLGGGGFMLIHRKGMAPVGLDYREQAPAGIRRDLYRDANGNPDPMRIQRGGLSVGVPGTVRGLLHALEAYGSGRVTRAQIIAPAIRLANRALVVDAHLAESIESFREAAEKDPAIARRFRELRQALIDSDGRARTRVDRSSMAITLEAIADRGADGFCDGEIARNIVRAVRNDGGVMTREDLAAYRVREVTPLRGSYLGHDVIGMPPPSSGGAVILETLNILHALDDDRIRAAYDWDYIGNNRSSAPPGLSRYAVNLSDPESMWGLYAHLLIESMKPAFADRATLLGDASPNVAADVAGMLDPARAKRIAEGIDERHAAPWTRYDKGSLAAIDGGTSHLSVIDADGMAVACTESVNLLFGSRILAPDTGVILNDTMDDFALDTTTPNAFGLRQSERNIVRAGARPLSSMSPTIVLKDGDVRLVVGASGGPRIITSTLQTLLHVVVGDRRVNDAVAEPRLHQQWLPDIVYVQPTMRDGVRAKLTQRGHTLKERKDIGHVQAIERLADGSLRAACDPMKGGRPAGK